MPIPEFQSLMLPLLKLLEDKQEYSMREIIETLAWEFDLTDTEKQKMLPSGQQTFFDNRVSWARTYLKKAGLVESPRRAFVKITNRGLEVIQQNLKEINNNFLSQYPEFVEFRNFTRSAEPELLTADDDWEQESSSDVENYQFSAEISTIKELLQLFACQDENQHTLVVEVKDNNIVITHLINSQKIVTVWNRSTALAITEAIRWYYD